MDTTTPLRKVLLCLGAVATFVTAGVVQVLL